jgi:hypothetical protein
MRVIRIAKKSGGGVDYAAPKSLTMPFPDIKRIAIFWDELTAEEIAIAIRAARDLDGLEELHFFSGEDQQLLMLLSESPVASLARRTEKGLLPIALKTCERDLQLLHHRLPHCTITMDGRRWPTSFVSSKQLRNRFEPNE